MKTETVTLVYFSPTGTTKKVVEGIAEDIGAANVETIDLTRPDTLSKEFDVIKDSLAILGAPVYAGRIPAEAEERFRKVKGDNTPAVIIVVYGNREFDDALIELKNLAVEQGFKPVGAAAFIGEHSFSSEDSPLAEGRPDVQDIDIAHKLGKEIAEKLEKTLKAEDIPELNVPGNVPLKERPQMPKNPPDTDKSLCTLCGTCASSCPTASITITNEVKTDVESCILCCACVKNCPEDARKMDNPGVERIRGFLREACKDRKEPKIFMN